MIVVPYEMHCPTKLCFLQIKDKGFHSSFYESKKPDYNGTLEFRQFVQIFLKRIDAMDRLDKHVKSR